MNKIEKIYENEEKMVSEILKIIQWISNNMEEIVNNGIVITDVIEEPMNQNYQSRTTYVLEYGKDDYGVIGVVADMGLSGSPSAWNHYREVMTFQELAEDIFCRILEAEDAIYDGNYKVFIREDLLEMIE